MSALSGAEPAFDAEITSSAAYLSAGKSGKTLLRVDLSTGRTRRLADAAGLDDIAEAQPGRNAARRDRCEHGSPVAARPRRPHDASQPRSSRASPSRGRESMGSSSGCRRAACSSSPRTAAPRRGSSTTRCAPGHVSLDRRHGGSRPARRCSAPTMTLSLFRAKLPSGPQRIVRQLPGRATCSSPPRSDQRWPKECGRGSDSHTVSSAATCRASGPSDSSDETRTFRFSPTRS